MMVRNHIPRGWMLVAIFSAMAVLMYILNVFVPMVFDDLYYAMDGDGGRISSLGDIFERQARDYVHYNGRVVSHSVVQFFCGITGKWLFDILNPLAWVAFVFMICRHVGRGALPTVVVFVWVFVTVWFVLPDQFVTTLQVAGSLNYLWGGVLVLWWIGFFERRAGEGVNKEQPAWGRVVIYGLVSFFCGVFVEFWSIPVFPAVLVWLWVRRIRPGRGAVWSLAGFFAGMLVVVLAPANFVRLEGVAATTGLWERVQGFVFAGVFGNKTFWALGVLTVTWLFVRRRADFVRDNVLWLTAMVVYLGFCFVAGAGWARVFFPVWVCAVILFFKLLATFRWNRIVSYALTAVAVAAFAVSYARELGNTISNRAVYDDLVAQLREGATVLRQRADFVRSKNTFASDVLMMEPSFWGNRAFARYWGAESVSVLPARLREGHYILPLEAGVGRVDRVVLRYEATGESVVRPTFLMLAGRDDGVLARWMARVPLLCEPKPPEVTLVRVEGVESFADLTLEGARVLVIKKPVGYERDRLLDVEFISSAR
jgi:hypothetical protein